MLFTHNVKKAKSVTHRNGDFDGKCEQGCKVFPMLEIYRVNILLNGCKQSST